MKGCVKALSYFLHDWKLIILHLGLILSSVLVSLLQSWPMAILIDCILTPVPHTDLMHTAFLAVLPHSMLGQLIGLTLIGMGLKLIQDVITLFRVIVANRVNNNGTMRVRNDLFDHLKGKIDADSMYRVCNDAQGPQLVLNVLLGAFVSSVTLILMISLLLVKSPMLTLFAMLVTPFLLWANHLGNSIRSQTVLAKEIDAHMVALVGSENTQEFRHATEDAANEWLNLNWRQEIYWLLVKTIFTIGGAIVFGYGGYLVMRDQFIHPILNGMTVGTLAVFMDYLGKLWEPLTRLTSVVAEIQPGMAGSQRIFEVLEESRK